jgi:hypothetical protein
MLCLHWWSTRLHALELHSDHIHCAQTGSTWADWSPPFAPTCSQCARHVSCLYCSMPTTCLKHILHSCCCDPEYVDLTVQHLIHVPRGSTATQVSGPTHIDA